MTLKKNKKLKIEEIESIRKAVQDSDIRSVHPDKLEDWAEYLVRKLKS
jgi:hypothetical protein|tara:strand:- start:1138 stop:1281 length:144 start_codon:yes stop_codon:yes gene_type:complete